MNNRYKIKDWAQYRGLSLYDVALKANVGHSTIHRVMRTGKVHPSTIRKIAAALNISVEHLQELPSVGSYRKTADTVHEPTVSADVFDGIIRDIGNIDPKYLIPLLTSIPEGPWETWFTSSPLELSSEYVFRPPGVTGANVFALRVADNSMEPVINSGDVVFVDPEEGTNNINGETKTIQTDEEIMIRYLYKFDVPNGPYYRLASEKDEDRIIHYRDATLYQIAAILQIRNN